MAPVAGMIPGPFIRDRDPLAVQACRHDKLRMLVIGLTGGIATGKSSVSTLLKTQQIPVIDADVIARQVVLPGTRAHRRIVQVFGEDILLPDGTLNRPKLGSVVFGDEEKRKALNRIVHPAVTRAIAWDVFKCWITGKKVCVLDVPLLIEGGLWKSVGKVVVVYCSAEIQLQRLMKRDGSSREDASARLNSQLPISDKLEYADQIIENSGSVQELEQEVAAFVEKLKRETGGWRWLVSWLIPPIGLASAGTTIIWRKLKREKPGTKVS